ncbi:hypothetical protein [Duganella sp. Dugasp56]|uniref:hypothetical protein n=1 Tax=Duganella sp. Dugasp56 TaxID=3243046 RepID=UPI00159E6E97
MATSSITLNNLTGFPAQFLVKKAGQVVASLPALEHKQIVVIPTTDTYQVIASTVINGNTYYSAPATVTGATGFLAQVIQDSTQGTYVFDVQEIGSTSSSELQFQSTWREDVDFEISKDGKPLQNVVCQNPFIMETIELGDTYSFQAIVNGVTTDVQLTDNPNATCTAVNDTTRRSAGYYTLLLS